MEKRRIDSRSRIVPLLERCVKIGRSIRVFALEEKLNCRFQLQDNVMHVKNRRRLMPNNNRRIICSTNYQKNYQPQQN